MRRPVAAGPEDRTILNTNVEFYNGSLANMIVITELVGLEHSAGIPVTVTDTMAGALKDASQIPQDGRRLGGR